MKRYAVYFSPRADHPLAEVGNRWLGWDAETGSEPERLPLDGKDAAFLDRVTEAPRRYGFHATLKPPFRLVEGETYEALVRDMRALADRTAIVDIGLLRLSAIGSFLALVPAAAPPALADLARDCVVSLDRFRAPPDAQELARRRRTALTPRQEAYLTAWGYPYVMEEFRFHMTLSGSLDEETLSSLRPVLDPVVSPALAEPVLIEDLCLFGDPGNGTGFRIVDRFSLTG